MSDAVPSDGRMLQELLQRLQQQNEEFKQRLQEQEEFNQRLQEQMDEARKERDVERKERDEERKALEKRLEERDEERKGAQRVRTLQQVFSMLGELRIPSDRASPTASQALGSVSESASGAARGDNASESASGAAGSVGTADGTGGDAAAAVGAVSRNRARANRTDTTAAGMDDPEKALHQEVKKLAFMLQFQCDGAGLECDAQVKTLAHMIKNEFLKKVPKIGQHELPAVLVGTVQLLGPYPGGNDFDLFNQAASVSREGGRPLLPYSLRNTVLMPKGLEVSMDNGTWVMEPLLPGEQPEGPDWRPTMWRVKVLAPNKVGNTFDMTLLAAGGHMRVRGKVNGVAGVHEGKFNVSLSTVAATVFTFKWKDVAIRSLVFVYLYTLAGQRHPATNLRDSNLLAEGIDRVRAWLQAANALGKALENDVEVAEACQAPSMELVRTWLDSLDDCPPLGVAEAAAIEANDDGAARQEG
jgi:hypothetical protein